MLSKPFLIALGFFAVLRPTGDAMRDTELEVEGVHSQVEDLNTHLPVEIRESEMVSSVPTNSQPTEPQVEGVHSQVDDLSTHLSEMETGLNSQMTGLKNQLELLTKMQIDNGTLKASLEGPEPNTPSRAAAPGMTIATWNVACFEKAKPKEIATTFAELGVDVLALQEDLEFTEEKKENALEIPGYSKVVACRGEELWNTEEYKNPMWVLGGRHIQNVIHVRNDRVEVVNSGYLARISDDTRAAKAPRCAVWADLRLKGGDTEVRLANVHLSGGRFTDEDFVTFTGEKEHEIGAVIGRLQPDILVGDFNSYASEEQVHANQAEYTPYQAAKKKSPAEFQQYLDWSREGVLSAEKRGYTRIQADCQTSKYGGTVDHMYFSNKRVSGDIAWCGGNTYQQSDHNMVVSVVRKVHGSGPASG